MTFEEEIAILFLKETQAMNDEQAKLKSNALSNNLRVRRTNHETKI